MTLHAPFPWFGGKSRAAAQIWSALGDVDCYVEPFGGSLAVLLARPEHHVRKVETVNDADGLLINWWRAVAADPEGVARWADWPVSEVDLTARHLWLVERRAELTARLHADPAWFDAQAAGWWVWGACCWIGSGWCSGDGPWVRTDDGIEVGNAGRGIHRQLPHLGNAGVGIHCQVPHLGDDGMGIAAWFSDIADRLRRVRITCGDWARVTTPSVVERHGTAGVVLDPPYPEGWNPDGAYAGQELSASEICASVFAGAVELGERGCRVVVCGYAGTWEPPAGWTARRWTARKGYAATTNQDRRRETLWCSPSCLPEGQPSLFGGGR
jgi:DNA adenine methylase